MAKISFLKPKPSIEVSENANLMQTLLSAGLPVASSCYGDGVCGKCKIDILEGAQNLSSPTDLEKLLKDRMNLEKNQRVSCQVCVQGDVTVDAAYW